MSLSFLSYKIQHFSGSTDSSFIEKFNYHKRNKILELTIKPGKTYLYFNVESDEYDEFYSAKSKGSAYNKLIRGKEFICLKG